MSEPRVYRLSRAGSKRPLVEIVQDGALYRIHWPDGEISDLANLTRCCDGAREWAERETMTAPGKISGARRLKSLENFSWSKRICPHPDL
jgi:hypothetical protein